MPLIDKKLSKLYGDFKKSESNEFLLERKRKKDFFQTKFSKKNISNFDEGDVREIVRMLWAFQKRKVTGYVRRNHGSSVELA